MSLVSPTQAQAYTASADRGGDPSEYLSGPFVQFFAISLVNH
jgi:hypothetical protein